MAEELRREKVALLNGFCPKESDISLPRLYLSLSWLQKIVKFICSVLRNRRAAVKIKMDSSRLSFCHVLFITEPRSSTVIYKLGPRMK